MVGSVGARVCPPRGERRKGVFALCQKFRSSRNKKDTLSQRAFFVLFVFDTESGILLSKISER